MPYVSIQIIKGHKPKNRPGEFDTVGWQVCFKNPQTSELTPCEKGYFKVEVYGYSDARLYALALRDKLNAGQHA
jgi:hypothetical protein